MPIFPPASSPVGGAFGVVRWVVPALTVLVLITLGVVRPSGPIARALDWPTRTLQENSRRLSIAVIALVSAANSASIILLIHLLVNGAETKDASTLMRAALHMWVVNVLLFGLWFWQLEAEARSSAPPACRPTATFSSRSRRSRR